MDGRAGHTGYGILPGTDLLEIRILNSFIYIEREREREGKITFTSEINEF